MVDMVDLAQEREQRWREAALRQVSLLDNDEEMDTDTPRFCEDCEEPIPLARVKAVPRCTRCIDCQKGAEKCQRL